MTDVKHKLPETERKTKMIVFRVREDEYDRLKSLSDELRGYKSPNEIARLITLEWLDHKQTFKPKQVFDNETFELMKDLQILASELRNDIQGIARNFNQYVKLLNTHQLRNDLSIDDFKNIDKFRQQFRKTRKNIDDFNREVGSLSQQSK
ncbi:hypothetical protein [Staphylococcus sp. HMSC069E07]|uniref:hypothetical protein n=1 Tax=Staphylococcus sp. HMSC069E07 TaxID=1715214 RepID=UPI0008A8C0FA|nr:hypothetical protein [Staphylococcus sp. HMSC069E07]OHQ43010.1 hypothetical protein HMPREF2735_00820 [Staphylococcus sp. HMSC069E07]